MIDLKNHLKFSSSPLDATPIYCLSKEELESWRSASSKTAQNWAETSGFEAKNGEILFIPHQDGSLEAVLVGKEEGKDVSSYTGISSKLPKGTYYFKNLSSEDEKYLGYLAWALDLYIFDKYKPSPQKEVLLYVEEEHLLKKVLIQASSIFLARDLINTPAEDMGPTELSEAAVGLAQTYKGKAEVISGEQLLDQNFPAIHLVGRASNRAPRLIDFKWGKTDAPKVTLVGKGVCFDTGGLNLKPDRFMLLMKKDMGGAAHVLALAQMIIESELPVNLRVLIPAVDNNVSANAMRPMDVVKTRSGLTVEIGHTDAEGRVILSDALTYALEEKPDILIDFATLTGAGRVALGTELPAFFCNHEDTAKTLLEIATKTGDPIWRLPLWENYREQIKGKVAEISNDSSSPYGGAITAALFLQEFIKKSGHTTPWLHFDLMGWNYKSSPGHPEGGEAMGVRAVFELLRHRFA